MISHAGYNTGIPPSLPPDLVVMEFMLQPGRDNTTIVCLQAHLPHSLKACRKESAREFVATVLPPLTYTESKVAPWATACTIVNCQLLVGCDCDLQAACNSNTLYALAGRQSYTKLTSLTYSLLWNYQDKLWWFCKSFTRFTHNFLFHGWWISCQGLWRL